MGIVLFEMLQTARHIKIERFTRLHGEAQNTPRFTVVCQKSLLAHGQGFEVTEWRFKTNKGHDFKHSVVFIKEQQRVYLLFDS